MISSPFFFAHFTISIIKYISFLLLMNPPFISTFLILKTYQQPVDNLLITFEKNITTFFGDMKTIFPYPLF